MDTKNIRQTISNFLDVAIEHLKKTVWYDPILAERLRGIFVTLNTRTRTVGGSCNYTYNRYTGHALSFKIEFGMHYLERATLEEVRNTVAHEYAHAYHVMRVGVVKRESKHDYMWKSIHRAMGGNGEQFHQVEVQKNKVQRWIVKVNDGSNRQLTFSTRTWNKAKDRLMADGTRRYTLVEHKTV